jgi:phosphoribosylglycinamide formyltransferase-1
VNKSKKIVVFASGAGSNFKRIFQHINSKNGAEFYLLSNNPQCGAVEFAINNQITIHTFSKEELQNPANCLAKLTSISPDIIVLAGFLLKIPEHIVAAFPNKIINIHPALLPKFGGKGMYGKHVHQAVFDAKETETGITIHYVNEHYDEGNIIAQFKVALTPADTPEIIEQKVRALETEHYPKVIHQLLQQL